MIKADKYYFKNLEDILENGVMDENPRPKYKDGTPAYTKFITQVFEDYDIARSEFPITTLRNTAVKTGIREILWIYQKASNSLSTAREMGISWWDEWNVGDGTIGNRYGNTVKKYGIMDNLLNGLTKDPFGRRHIMNLYQYDEFESSAGLYPCAYETIWSVRRLKGIYYLDMTLVQRSNDYITAGYINKIQYVALQMMVAGHCGYKVGKFCHLTQNLHVYDRHYPAMLELLNREPLDLQPTLVLNESKNFYEYTVDDFEIYGTDKITKIKSPLEIAI